MSEVRRLLACWMTSKYLLGTNDALGSSVVRDCRPGCRGSARSGHPYGWHVGRGDDPFDGTARCTPRPCTMVRHTMASRRLAAPSHGRMQTGHHPVGGSPGCYSCDPSVDADRAGCGRVAASPQASPWTLGPLRQLALLLAFRFLNCVPLGISPALLASWVGGACHRRSSVRVRISLLRHSGMRSIAIGHAHLLCVAG